jgi:hypothetical protein
MKYRIFALMILGAAAVWAGPIAPCQAGTVASVMAQGECSIGSLVFDFTSYQVNAFTHDWPDVGPGVLLSPGTNSSPDAASVEFQPLGTALAPGFQLSASFSTSGNAAAGHFVISQVMALFDFTVSTADGNPVGLQIGTGVAGASATTSVDPTCATGSCNVNAGASSGMYFGDLGVVAGVGQNQFSGESPTNPPFGLPASALVDPFSSADVRIVLAASSEVISHGSPASASASLRSAEYWFTVLPSEAEVPEPGTWVLLSMAGLPFLLWRARRVR